MRRFDQNAYMGRLVKTVRIALANLAVFCLQGLSQDQPIRFEPESSQIPKIKTGNGVIEMQSDSSFTGGKWSGGQQLWLRDAKVGDSVEITINVPTSGYYSVSTGLTKAVDYGVFDFLIGGKAVKTGVDCYSQNLAFPSPLTLAELVFLESGPLKVSAVVRGANPLSVKNYMLGGLCGLNPESRTD